MKSKVEHYSYAGVVRLQFYKGFMGEILKGVKGDAVSKEMCLVLRFRLLAMWLWLYAACWAGVPCCVCDCASRCVGH